MKPSVVATILALVPLVLFAGEQSVTVTLEDTLREPEIADVTSPAAVATARSSGAAQAAADVASGRLEIIVYGEPIDPPSPPVSPRDPDTGLPLRSIHNCTPTPAFEAYVAAYNHAVRDAHAKRKK